MGFTVSHSVLLLILLKSGHVTTLSARVPFSMDTLGYLAARLRPLTEHRPICISNIGTLSPIWIYSFIVASTRKRGMEKIQVSHSIISWSSTHVRDQNGGSTSPEDLNDNLWHMTESYILVRVLYISFWMWPHSKVQKCTFWKLSPASVRSRVRS